MKDKISIYYQSQGSLIKKLISDIDKEEPNLFYEVNDPNTCDIILAEFDSITTTIPNTQLDKLVVLSDKPNSLNILKLMSDYSVKHIIGANSNKLVADFSITAKRIKANSTNNIDEYGCLANVIFENVITSSTQINAMIDSAVSKVDFSDYFDSPINYVKTVSNELLTNAIYNAPVDDQGNPRFEDQSRTIAANLSDNEAAIFKLGKHDGNIYISVEDKFGRLTYDKVIKSLSKCANDPTPSDKDGGAGLGLFLIYSNVNRFIIYNEPNAITKFIAIIESAKRYNSYRKRITSFHYYTGAKK